MNERNTAQEGGKKLTLLSVLAIQGAVIVYTGSGICAKMAASHPGSIELFGRTINWMSPTGYFWLFMEVVCLGLYAVLWQQIIKRFDLSVAYCNRAFAVCWSFLWGVLLFGEKVKPLNIVGIAIVLAGILMVNMDAE
ncbi:MAG: EamA family transporter [Lachnospiraceae bacterium]|nr:EamA family transporter [Lachnospiraceae bacterium]